MDLAQASGFVLDTAGITLVTGIVVSLLKPYMEETFLPLTAPLHNATIRLLSIVVGIGLTILGAVTAAQGWPPLADLISAAGRGALAGVAAIATYHLYTTGMWDDNAPDAPATGATVPVQVMPRLPADPKGVVSATTSGPVSIPPPVPPPPPPGSDSKDPLLKS